MKGYAIEVQLIRWSCKCKRHIDGVCQNSSSNKREKIREAYLGNFGWAVKTLGDALTKWDHWLHSLDKDAESGVQ